MKYFLFIVFFISGCVKSQPIKIIPSKPTVPAQSILIIFVGESNAGGTADYSVATSTERSQRALKIFNNYTQTFQQLLLGFNGLLLHTGLVDNSGSGLEIGLANKYDSSSFGVHTAFLLKAGQGGSTISQWIPSTTPHYYDTLTTRATTAVGLLTAATGNSPRIFIVFSQGINDMLASTPAATWKANVETFFTNIRASLATITGSSAPIPIIMTRFDSMPTNLTYETVIGQIDTEVSDCTAISTIGATLKDANHWDYYGFRNVLMQAIAPIIASYL